ncbi:hypothetical protein DKG77_13460 [Flagellimonas aquimarina]|uniref:DUF2721 domain-containing protein n=1 Tax=Flagellimonas aquimarina TaxID=2201895 RepID=A0A316KVY9_9FLAO|nr:DUF2721 domain-containing protein [Allomuricauda koreensis]PWL37776.1 hypothetical protein DKG77_13460 [Allomuricauda koreensis]
MESWYVPITIVPGIGLLLMSTSTLLGALSTEIKNLIEDHVDYEALLRRKLTQLKLVNYAMVFLYVSVACFVLSGLIAGLYESTHTMNDDIPIYFSVIGILSCLTALILLTLFSFRAVKIKQDQFKEKL